MDWVASLAIPAFGDAKIKVKKKNDENDCEHYGRNKGKHSGQVSYCNYKNFFYLE